MNQGEKSEKETSRKEKRNTEDANRLSRERDRKTAYLVREQAIEKASEARRNQQAEKHSKEETEQLTRQQERKKAYFAREKKIADTQEARKSRDKEQQPN